MAQKPLRSLCSLWLLLFAVLCSSVALCETEGDVTAREDVLSVAGRDALPAEKQVFDCGVNTLYLVLRLKGMDADLEEIRGKLPRDEEKGSSVQDLENYLHSVGIATDARLMRLSDLSKKRDAMAIILTQGKDGKGHFIVARVLPKGQLQIVDSLLGSYLNEHAAKSKESLPVILIDVKERAWAWKVFAAVGVAMLVLLFSHKGQRMTRMDANENSGKRVIE